MSILALSTKKSNYITKCRIYIYIWLKMRTQKFRYSLIIIINSIRCNFHRNRYSYIYSAVIHHFFFSNWKPKLNSNGSLSEWPSRTINRGQGRLDPWICRLKKCLCRSARKLSATYKVCNYVSPTFLFLSEEITIIK